MAFNHVNGLPPIECPTSIRKVPYVHGSAGIVERSPAARELGEEERFGLIHRRGPELD